MAPSRVPFLYLLCIVLLSVSLAGQDSLTEQDSLAGHELLRGDGLPREDELLAGHDASRVAGSFLVADSLPTRFYETRDSTGMQVGYLSQVLTPVCETGKCYVVEIELAWYLDGSFAGFDTLPGKPLTRLDHQAFRPADYAKLYRILADDASVLGLYEEHELVAQSRPSGLDGFTGATIAGVKESVIDGAVYSCHTLWHIVHGAAVDSMRAATMNRLSYPLVERMFAARDHAYPAFLVEHFSAGDFLDYLPLVLRSIAEGEGYYPKRAIEAMPAYVLGDERAQAFFAREFGQLDYFARVAVLEKQSQASLSPAFREALEGERTDRDTYLNTLISKCLR